VGVLFKRLSANASSGDALRFRGLAWVNNVIVEEWKLSRCRAPCTVEAELLQIRDWLYHGAGHHWHKVWIQTFNKDLSSRLNSRDSFESRLSMVVEDIYSLLSVFF
ncbi:Unknown protein, partial [Striga hermonthica]